jgi:hypothetical protein
MTSPGAAPEPADPASSVAEDAVPVPADVGPAAGAPAARGALANEPVVPEQSPEDTDAAWGEYRQRDDDRLYRDRPPHWDDF